MNKEDKIKYWLDIADYDLETAKTLLAGGRWLYVAFMCHQVLEKTLKAYWVATQNTEPPYTHNLARLNEGCNLYKEMTEKQLSFIDLMIPMNIEARYPSYKESLSKTLNSEFCTKMINQTKDLQLWIKNKL